MEVIILFIISAIISAFFKDKKSGNKQAPNKGPVQRSQHSEHRKPMPQRTGQTRSLEDYAKEVFRDLENKFGEQPKAEVEKAKEIIEEKVAPILERSSVSEGTRSFENSRSTRPAMSRGAEIQKKVKQTENSTFNFPKTKNQLAQSIIMAEILGPPKSKR
ncbi:hypothetical protein MKZ08_06240 [Viridibacillus sp. FSL R5-0477]|uniref:Uncharacterized protein n=1 Tax=Viridibacillus arenosi FSL R5-213 TaxID=1227360 RepID=W4EP08_9BACL|nr:MULTISPECIES: hypothetical protein [Viridibacillus]ETT82343.1 hypothetical protein C176_15172 [Viridibacillus arenosi FSL R5-213]OMC85325.1 hypothetical protein BK130_00710 [Viridibacillus sp. FSL H8-0123]OMC87397.1 hypothetical protein BK128_08180 [Viridibacillus sp. FSL H7-0596]OMC92558.1 hypothetical protein BK137_05825 [Viridibacillus arenosi]